MRDFYNTQCYPELENNPWTFVAGPYEKKRIVETPSLTDGQMTLVGVPVLIKTEHTLNDCPTVYIIDSPRWNYEVRAYLDIDKNRDPRSLLWLNFMLSDRWAEIHTLFGDGTQLDAAMYGNRLGRTKWRKVGEDTRPVELSFLKLKEGKLEDG